MLKLYNTFTRKKQIFKPIHKKAPRQGSGQVLRQSSGQVGLYTCGPTVYDFAHIGNLRTYIFEDILERTLAYNGYEVKRVMNITDVGHLTSDADAGEDKIDRKAKTESKTPKEIADFYTRAFLQNLKEVNAKIPKIIAPASQYIKEQIELVKKLFDKGFAYETSQAIYFDIKKFKKYGKLSGQPLKQKITAARKEVKEDKEKKNSADFALWFKTVGRFKNHIQRWPSPWGEGFPGWHVECSAISRRFLGQPFDLHTGGVDHIGVHHENEIAQSEAAYGKPLAKFWLHAEHLLMGAEKMAKSEGNFLTLDYLIKKGFNPLAFRYLVLTSHYRSKLNFTWESLKSAQNALDNLYDEMRQLNNNQPQKNQPQSIYEKKFLSAIDDDLNTPKAIAFVWQIIKDNIISSSAKKQLLFKFDKILGLSLDKIKPSKIPLKIRQMAQERELLRRNQQFIQADQLRKKIESLGYRIEDTQHGPEITPSRHRS